jgi:hypothetical protein
MLQPALICHPIPVCRKKVLKPPDQERGAEADDEQRSKDGQTRLNQNLSTFITGKALKDTFLSQDEKKDLRGR